MRLLFLMDPYESLNLATETSLLCIDELLARGHEVFWVEEQQLFLQQNRVSAIVRPIERVTPFLLGGSSRVEIEAFDGLVVRKDPPFDKRYLHLTYLLDFVPPHVAVVNSPKALRAVNEKLYTLNWPDLCPPSVTTMDADVIREFVRQHGKAVVKPLDDCSGRGIRFVDPAATDFDTFVESVALTRHYHLVQQFVPQVVDGDKRIYLVDGEPIGWVNRVPAPGSHLANIHQGATCHPFDLGPRDLAIVDAVRDELKTRGLLLVGLDVIGGYMTEINVTSPSAVRQINEVTGARLEVRIVEALLRHVASTRAGYDLQLSA